MSEFVRCEACPVLDLTACPAEHHARYCALAAKGGVWTDKIRAKAAELEPGTSLGAPLDPLTFVTEARLAEDAILLASALPHDIDGVVGVARSGLMAASLIAARLHLPLWTVTRSEGIVWPGGGFRMGADGEPIPNHVVLIDDTIATGREMRALPDAVRERWPGIKLTRAVVYAAPDKMGLVDYCARSYPGPHYLAWNWQNAGHGERCGYDFDGILCRDFTSDECLENGRYKERMGKIESLYLPRRSTIPLIVTARHQAFETETKAWIERHGLKVDRLVMRDWGEPSADIGDIEKIIAFKAEAYADSDCTLFAESDSVQAEAIAKASRKPVLCPQAGKVFSGATATEPALPSMGRMAINYAKAQAQHTLDGRRKADDDTIATRLAICHDCEHLRASDQRCSLCGCPVEEATKLASYSCPDKPPRWKAIPGAKTEGCSKCPKTQNAKSERG